MKVTLSRQIQVHHFAAFAEMAWMERRPELGLICRQAMASGRRLSNETIGQVLPGLSPHGAANVIMWCKTLDICDEQGALKKLGEDVAQSDTAPVPEQGVYEFWVARHELFGTRILAVERLSSRREQRLEEIRDLQLVPDQGKVFRSVLEPQERFLLRKLLTNHGTLGCIPRETKAVCTLRWTIDFSAGRNQWRLEGALDMQQNAGMAGMRPMKHDGESVEIDVWDLARRWGTREFQGFGTWNAEERRLAVPLPGLGVDEMETFRKTISIPRVEVAGKGIYENVKIENVPIGPGNAKDAQTWAHGRFDRNITKNPAYRSRAHVRDCFFELVKDTPLESFNPTVPAHAQLLHEYEKNREIFWSFAAPVDLSPQLVKEEELAAIPLPTLGGA